MKTMLTISVITAAFCAGKIYESVKNRDSQKDYQLDVDQKGVVVYDNNRIAGFIPAGNTPLDSLIINDNL